MELFNKIRNWGKQRDLHDPNHKFKQLAKVTEEHGELSRAMLKNDVVLIIDAIGDKVIALTNLAAQYDLKIEDCIQHAFEEIEKRQGKTVDGVFSKVAPERVCQNCKYFYLSVLTEPCYSCDSGTTWKNFEGK
jgi:NTP pyrophosphatase (non-canonical NTP hydrolase)